MIASFFSILTSASRSPSAIAELLVCMSDVRFVTGSVRLQGSVHITHVISSNPNSTDVNSSQLSGRECAVERPSSPWLRPIKAK